MNQNMKSIRFIVTVCVSLAAWFSPHVASSQQSSDSGYHIAIVPAGRIRMTVTESVTAPNMNFQEWGIVAAYPPESDSQKNVKASLNILGVPNTRALVDHEKSSLHQQILRLSYPVANGHEVTAQAIYELNLFKRLLLPGKPKDPIRSLTTELRNTFLADSFGYDYKSADFQKWMTQASLTKNDRESALSYSYRLLQYISSNFKYALTWGEASPASVICSRGSSNCGGLSCVYVAALRANGIPARIISGRTTVSSTEDNDAATYHNKVEFFAEGIGWVPVEVAGASDNRSVDNLIGNDNGDLVVMTFDEPVLDSQRRALQEMQFIYGKQTGSWNGYKLTDRVKVEPMSTEPH